MKKQVSINLLEVKEDSNTSRLRNRRRFSQLAKIGDKAFTITFIEDSDYTQGDQTTKGVKITTKETFDIEIW